jgi:hypothetical protein
MMDSKSQSKNAGCITEKFCNGPPGGPNLQFNELDNLILRCTLEEQQRNIGLFDESLGLFTGVLFDSLGCIQVELEACQMGDKFLVGQYGMGGFQIAKIDTHL